MSIKLRISITKEVLEATKDCRSEYEFSITNCAISFAIRKIWPTAFVGYSRINVFGNRNSPLIEHNQEDFIESFDSATPAERAAMQPFSFDIEVPDEVINEVNIEEVRRICEGSKTLEIV